jgi:hypothetical protein
MELTNMTVEELRRTVDRSQPQATKGAEIQNPFGGILEN